MKVYALSDIGKARELNEDSYFMHAGCDYCCVADGMGGHAAGEVASAIAVNVFANRMRDILIPPHERLRRAVSAANLEIYERAKADPSTSGMGTTMTALLLDGNEMHIAHVGDSRAYLFRNRALLRVTTDHTLVEEMVLKGVISVSEARVHPKRNIITRALGTYEDVNIDLLRIHIMPTDMFLLCSDGLSNYVSDHEIVEVLNSRLNGDNKLSALVGKALDKGGSDNITAVLVTLEEERE